TALANDIAERDFTDCRLEVVQRATQRKLRHTAKKWGIHIDGFELTDLCESTVYRLMSSDGSQTLVLGTDE
ncbi:hypothetical protein LCGC14_1932760, partial [marine sediment metagenome]